MQATLYDYYWANLTDWLPYMWDSLYTMCDPAAYDGQMSGTAVRTWCDNLEDAIPGPDGGGPAPDVVRPVRTASAARLGSTSHELSGGGALFHDLGMPASNVSGHLRVTVRASSTFSLSVKASGWSDTPADWCPDSWGFAQGQGGDPSADIVLEAVLPAGCDNATIEVIDTYLDNPSHSVEVAWSGWEDGAVIGNGTITLGVTTDGSLGIGSPPGALCRGAGAKLSESSEAAVSSLTYGDGVGPGLVDEATSFDAIRGSWHEMCQGDDLGEGWAVADANQDVDGHAATWFKPVFTLPQFYPGKVESFTHTATEATSVVLLGSEYKLIHHWHPSSVDPRVYQLDVTVEPASGFGTLPLTYRRVVPLEVDGRNIGEVGDYVTMARGSSDGASDATDVLFWYAGDEGWPGRIDNPLVGLPHIAYDYMASEYWTARWAQGLAVDVPIGSGTRTTPNAPDFSMFYGFADTTGQANSVLSSLGAATFAVAQQAAADSTHIVLVGYKDTP